MSVKTSPLSEAIWTLRSFLSANGMDSRTVNAATLKMQGICVGCPA